MNQKMSEPFLEYNPVTHKYWIDGRELLSVTTILQQAGVTQQFGLSDEHRSRGLAVHSLCEEDDRDGLDMRKVGTALRGFVKAWRDFRSVSGFVPTDIEKRVWCPTYGYAGTMDRAGTRRGSPFAVVLDIKSMRSGSPPDVVRYQTVAYCHAYKPGQVFERLAVAVRPDGSFGVKAWGPETFQADLARWLQIVATAKKVLEDA